MLIECKKPKPAKIDCVRLPIVIRSRDHKSIKFKYQHSSYNKLSND